ncbi:Site-specific recombinase XerC [Paracoccus alkenifer]|uniref:Site-specific recombinase XerC n=2 Tax=Paracoccus alkenifer TaxID=65735 RepID=A0A1H6LLI4_9RHOB|nr:Site-specific recombinase XerC [Paracoccus alkenifer]
MGYDDKTRHIRQMESGSFEFRKRFPRASGLSGEFKRRFQAGCAVTMAQEYARVLAEYDAVASGKPVRVSSPDDVSVSGRIPKNLHTSQDHARVVAPSGGNPPKTLADAADLYLRDRLRMGRDIQGTRSLTRIRKHMEAATGVTFDQMPLVDLNRQHARDTRDYLMRLRKGRNADGDRLSPASVRRALVILSALTNYALEEFDLADTCRNPFRALPLNAGNQTAIERRDALPDDVFLAMRDKLTKELRLIWRILAGTGCRVAEVTGLRIQDVQLDDEMPHVMIRHHEGRRLKTASSVRSVPLVGDALVAVREAVGLAGTDGPLFPRYARPRGADAASAILMKHLRMITTDKRHVVHSLRHRMKDKMRLAGIPKDVQDLILGHASASVAESYGSMSVRLMVAYREMQKLDDH